MSPLFRLVATDCAGAKTRRPKIFSIAGKAEKPNAEEMETVVRPGVALPDVTRRGVETVPAQPEKTASTAKASGAPGFSALGQGAPEKPVEVPSEAASATDCVEAEAGGKSTLRETAAANPRMRARRPARGAPGGAENRVETCPPQPPASEEKHTDGNGLLSYEKWWFLNDVDIHVGGTLLSGMPISLHGDTLRMINDTYSYFIPLCQIEYIRTLDGLSNLDTLWQGKDKSV